MEKFSGSSHVTPSFSFAWRKVKGDNKVFVGQVCLYMYNIHVYVWKQSQREYYTFVFVEWVTNFKIIWKTKIVVSHEC